MKMIHLLHKRVVLSYRGTFNMAIFTSQTVHCNICGKKFETKFGLFQGRVCSAACWEELDKRKTRSILGLRDEHRK